MNQPSASTFNAFISYNRGVDRQLARSLRSALHAFARPWYRLRALRIFLDDSSLTANPALWPSIQRALGDSEYFILLCSPEAARSDWVKQELTHFLRSHPRENVLIALTDGAIVWDPKANDFDWARTTSVPPVLAGVFRDAPRYIDLRAARKTPAMLRRPVYRELIADLAAPLHHREKDQIFGDDLRILRRNRGLAGSAVLALTVATVAATLFAIDSRRQTNAAHEQGMAALVNSMVSQSEALRDSQPATAIRLGLAAYAVRPSDETRATLVRRLVGSRFASELPAYAGAQATALTTPGLNDPIVDVRGLLVSTDGRVAVVGGGETPSEVWDVSEPARPHLLSVLNHPKAQGWETGTTYAIAGSPDGTLVLDGNSIWDLSDPAHPVPLTYLPRAHSETTWTVAYNAARKLGFTGGGSMPINVPMVPGEAELWDLSDPRHPQKLVELPGFTGSVWSASFTPDGHYLITGSDATDAWVWDISRPAAPVRIAALSGHPGPVWTVAVSSTGSQVVTGSNAGYAALWDIRSPGSPRRLATLPGTSGNVWASAFSPDGKLVVTGSISDSTAVVWDISVPTEPRRAAGLTSDGPVNVVAFDPRTGQILTADFRVTRFWSDHDSVARQDAALPGELVELSEDGKVAVFSTGTADRPVVSVWSMSNGRAVRKIGDIDNADATYLTPDGTRLLVYELGRDSPMGVWDITATKVERAVQAGDSYSAISPDGTLMCGGTKTQDQVALWSIAAGAKPAQVGTLSGTGSCYDVTFTKNHLALLKTQTLTGTKHDVPTESDIQIWDISNPSQPRRGGNVAHGPEQFDDVVVSPDGRSVAIAGLKSSTLWDISDPQKPRQTATLATDLVALMANGAIGVGVGERSSTLWDLTDPARPLQLAIIDGRRAYRAAGSIVTADTSGQRVPFDISTVVAAVQDPVKAACAIVGRGFTTDEWNQYAPGQPYQQTCPA
jgi:WD40 repeat protein